jgi:hypothetical protein
MEAECMQGKRSLEDHKADGKGILAVVLIS